MRQKNARWLVLGFLVLSASVIGGLTDGCRNREQSVSSERENSLAGVQKSKLRERRCRILWLGSAVARLLTRST